MARRPTGVLQGAQVALIALCALSLLLALIDSRDGVTRHLRPAAGVVMTPVQQAVNAATRPIGNFISDWQELGSRKARIAELETANAELRARLHQAAGDDRRLAELDALLQQGGLAQFKLVPARVVAIGSNQGFGNTVLIDVGSQDGVRYGMNVVSGSGLVGRVVSIMKRQSTVALITDPSSTVGARVEGSGEIGFVTGLGQLNNLQLQLLDPYADLKVGDRLVSFGVARGIYASGLPIGTVTAIRGKAGTSDRVADVQPFVAIGSIDVVGVMVTKPRTDPRDALLPARPTPTPIATPLATSDAAAPQSAGPTATPTGGGA